MPAKEVRIAITPRVLHFNTAGGGVKKPFTITFQRDFIDDEVLQVVAIIFNESNEKIGTQVLNIPLPT
nr:hypothetical protein [Candidatus Sigynarchaeota archaeon]